MYKTKLCVFGKDEEHRVWTVTSAEEGVSKTVVFSYGTALTDPENHTHNFDRNQTRDRVCFFINHVTGEAVIIDNGEWDLLCFDIEYDRKEVRNACDLFLQFIYNNHKLCHSHNYEFKDYDDMMVDMC